MDATVNDFLSEIDEIAPLSTKDKKQPECSWKQCIDENTGYPYYWNTVSDEVTWEAPSEFKKNQDKDKGSKSNKKPGLYIPLQADNVYPRTSNLNVPTKNIKIYKLEEDSMEVSNTKESKNDNIFGEKQFKSAKKKFLKPASSDSEDESVALISSYSGNSDSEDENDCNKDVDKEKRLKTPSSKTEGKITYNNMEKVLPPKVEVKHIELQKTRFTEISSFALLAGYSSDSESDTDEPTVSTSTLFPIREQVTLEQFEEKLPPPKEQNLETTNTNTTTDLNLSIDSKAFQRKRRINVDLINAPKRQKEEEPTAKPTAIGRVEYSGFTSGGVLFARKEEEVKVQERLSDETEEMRATLTGKLGFLIEGHSQVSPVQTLMIQIETLQSAMKEGGLVSSYFEKWLKDTSTELINLERDAAPSGWTLEWDRSNKRYFYRNKTTDECQWEYPEQRQHQSEDIIRRDEAMDICTTPPLPNDSSPIAQPKPPPPPVISENKQYTKMAKDSSQQVIKNPNEPLPPGVEVTDVTEETVQPVSDTLTSALDSFYSDLASISEAKEPVPPPPPKIEAEVKLVHVDGEKKKKKTKVKLAQGLAMKKKGVSKLVEKWKNVQNSL